MILLNPSWLVQRYVYRFLQKYAPVMGELVLDAGCGEKPYASLFKQVYLGIDLPPSDDYLGSHKRTNADIYSDVQFLPFKDETFTGVLSTFVITHLVEPQRFFNEAYRVLRSGGILVVCERQMWHTYGVEADYWRFTANGLKLLAHKAGFKVIDCQPIGNFLLRLGVKLAYAAARLDGRQFRFVRHPISQAFILIINLVFAVLERLLPKSFKSSSDAVYNFLIARKI